MRRKKCTTVFFLSFDPKCKVHQTRRSLGITVRRLIASALYLHFIKVFTGHFPVQHSLIEEFYKIEDITKVEICQAPRPGFDNGEIDIRLLGIRLEENVAHDFLMRFKQSIEVNPIVIRVAKKNFRVSFSGWGFRYI